MEDEGVDTTVIESLQHQLGRMADFPPLLTSSVDVPRIKSQAMRHPDETTLFEKYVDPKLNSSVYISLYPCYKSLKYF